jgi:hypothetical protein
MEVFPGLYSLASNKEAFIADNFDSVSGFRQWNISFVRSLNDWEVDNLASLYSLLYSYILGGGADKIWWVPNRMGKYEVRSFYIILTSSVSFPFPWKSIWRTKAFEGGVLCVVSGAWQNSYFGHFEEEKYGVGQ